MSTQAPGYFYIEWVIYMSDNYTPKNEWELQYEREYNRILQAIRRQEKLGYYVPPEVRPTPPSKVKVMSSTEVERLIQLTPKEIRKHSVWIDKDSGEAYEGLDVVNSHHKARPSTANIQKTGGRKSKQISIPTQRKKHENIAPPKDNNLNMQIIDSITEMIERWSPAPYWRQSWLERKTRIYVTIKDKWYNALEKEGAYQLAYRLENMAYYYHRLVDRLLHASDDEVEDNANLNEFMTFLTGVTLTAEESDFYTEQASEIIRDSVMGNSFG